jgi:bisphosphoglycerate-independent phosphoglycerate mutase (AlkP superfamily)
MGYESKLYIAEKSSLKDDDGMTYVSIIAMFDMCKIGNLVNVFEDKTDCYFYADDGNTKVLEDMYGDALTEATVEDVIYVLEEAVDNGENYRRLFPLLSALKTIYEQQKNGIWKEVVVLHYGY